MQAHQSAIGLNRYPGVKPFRTNEKELFFGREQDIERLYNLIFVKQSVVLYGKSGYGKSSLINAGIIPRLQEENEWVCFNIRFNYFSKHEQTENLTPSDNIKLRIKEELDNDQTSPLDELLPEEESFWYVLKNYQYQQKRSRFIFFFDQFEELFSYPKEQVEEFSEQLSQFLYATVPVKFKKKLAEMDEAGGIQDDLYAFVYEKLDIKVVFSVRSDRLSQLNMLTDRHPAILQNCIELDALHRQQAEIAITGPALLDDSSRYITPVFTYTEDALKAILDNVCNHQDGKIELGTLQIICRYVEEELVYTRKQLKITAPLLGKIPDIFKQYYESILNKLHPMDRKKARYLIEDELLEGGRRNPLAETYIKNKFGLEESLLQQLEASSLLRKERDAAGRMLIELSHDSLIIPITIARQKRLQREQEERAFIEREARRKIDFELDQLQKARELDELDKKGLQLRKTETLKRQVNLYKIQLKLKTYRKNLQMAIRGILFLTIFISSLVWMIIATYKFISRGNRLEAQKNEIEKNNEVFDRVLHSYDSIQHPEQYNQLKEIRKRYRELQQP